tara:strand:- start:6764 stop:7318 length:555 start_codon:yes stop_codon:yes gene_type:complete
MRQKHGILFIKRPMITLRRLKNITYILLSVGLILSAFRLFNWEIYPALQISLCLLLGMVSLLISEFVKNLNEQLKKIILATVFSQILLSSIVIINREFVVEYWRLVFIPSLFIVFVCTYGLSLRKEEKHQPIFKWMTMSLMAITFIRFFIYHEYIDYSIEFLFLIFIILIIRSKKRKADSKLIY